MIRSLEEHSFNAWPALRIVHYDGWLLRFAKGYTRRANSVNPIYSSTLPLDDKISYCEDVYRQNEQDTIFKMTSAAQPPGLDVALDQRGYRKEAVTSVQTLCLKDIIEPGNAPGSVVLSPTLTDQWISDFCALHQQTQSHRATMALMLENIVPDTAYALIKDSNETVAVGMAVREGAWVGLFDIVTNPQCRGRGYGTTLMRYLLCWGKNEGAEHAYLQVMLDNAPALKLYDRLGFAEAYRYWYRVRRR